jgi:hypothetical protein
MSFEVDYPAVYLSDSTYKANLSYVPTSPVSVDIIGGPAQALTADFTVSDSTIVWKSTNTIGLTDTIRAIYDRS